MRPGLNPANPLEPCSDLHLTRCFAVEQPLAFRHQGLGEFRVVVRIECLVHFMGGEEAGLARERGRDAAGELVAEGGEMAAIVQRQRTPAARQPFRGKRRRLRIGGPLPVFVESGQALRGECEDQRDGEAARAGGRRGVQIIAPLIETIWPEM